MFKTCEELRAKIAEYTAELDSKFNGCDGKRYIMLCGGTGCVAGGTMNIKEKFEEYIKELFSKFYGIYVRKGSREQAYKTWKKKLIKLKTEEEILDKARKIAKLYQRSFKEWEANETDKKFIPLCSSWLNSNIPDQEIRYAKNL